jgi:phospholipid-translocating ATPase
MSAVYIFSSWTFLTWIVVVGSSFVMLLWIVIYSFFESSDFNDEVVILFGNVPFWTSVVISIVVAVGEFYRVETV